MVLPRVTDNPTRAVLSPRFRAGVVLGQAIRNWTLVRRSNPACRRGRPEIGACRLASTPIQQPEVAVARTRRLGLGAARCARRSHPRLRPRMGPRNVATGGTERGRSPATWNPWMSAGLICLPRRGRGMHRRRIRPACSDRDSFAPPGRKTEKITQPRVPVPACRDLHPWLHSFAPLGQGIRPSLIVSFPWWRGTNRQRENWPTTNLLGRSQDSYSEPPASVAHSRRTAGRCPLLSLASHLLQ